MSITMDAREIQTAPEVANAASLGCTCRRLRRMARLVTQLYDEALSAHDLTIAQFGLMTTIAEHRSKTGKDISIGALANIVGLDPTTLNRNLNTLQRDKLVDVRPDKNDRRVRAVALTAAGRQRLRDAVPAWRAAQADLERRLGTAATAELNGSLDRARDRLVESLRPAAEKSVRTSHSSATRA
ncbi:MAG TPA: MarR family transcriptional regulator [Beijerinckiaceae bacterium]|jgi:DNA-binding MarR family transcriptional regulator|nr:MarR family transcriptional regulator [Beijerinckiaceae bacterium]